MLTLEGSPSRFCSGLSRRVFLRAGSLGIAGFTLPELYRGCAASASTGGRAKNVIVLYLPGGPSQLDTFDPKPDAPAEIRGEFGTIRAKCGVRFCDQLPLTGAMSDRISVVRSIVLSVAQHEHTSSAQICGYSNQERDVIGDRPSMGSVLSYRRQQPGDVIPRYVSIHRNGEYEGHLPAYLGPTHAPFFAQGPMRRDLDPGVVETRLTSRRRLLERVDALRRTWETDGTRAQEAFTERAFTVLGSSRTREAFDLDRENPDLRKRYGVDNFLLARRLVEAGVNYVALDFGDWDTHENNHPRMRKLLPELDRAYTTLLQDLDDRGLLQETIVVLWGEFGRTPQINSNGGRDHWIRVMSVALAGGGLRAGQIIGETDAVAGDPKERPLPLRAIHATMYAALGIHPKTIFPDALGRPTPLIDDAEPIPELL
jgi:hypothetical protein